jgi:hypothetical protein
MANKIKRILPSLALISALITVVGLVLVSNLRQTALADSGETRAVVEKNIEQIQGDHPGSISDPVFLNDIKDFQKSMYVVYVWLVAPDGQITYVTSPATSSQTVQQAATDETRRILDSLPEGQLSAEQEILLLTASTIQAEGEHNDVFGHMVRSIQAPDGSLVGLVGVAYDISTGMATPDILYMVSLLVSMLALGVYWLSLPVWVFIDARQKGEKAWVWAMFVLIGNLVALIAYILVRFPQPVKK